MAHFLSKARCVGSCIVPLALWSWITPPVFSQVTVLEVGPHGTYATIQGAIDIVVNGADTEIRVERDVTYNENLEVPDTFDSGSLEILGGWDATFSTRDLDPKKTVIDGGSAIGSVIEIDIEGGSLLVDGFTLTNGRTTGAGIQLSPDPGANTSKVVIRNNRIEGNVANVYPVALGGGILAEPRGTQRLEIVDCRIRGNTASSWNDGSALGGGICLETRNDSTFLIEDCEIDGNSVTSEGGERHGAGVHLRTSDSSKGMFYDSSVFGNSILGTGTSKGSGGVLEISLSSSMEVARTGWAANEVDAGDATPQLVTISDWGPSSFRLTDSGIGLGDDGGLAVTAASSATVHLVNLTVVDNPGTGILASQEESSTVAIYNTIAFRNGTNLSTSGTVDAGSNLIGVDPLFVDGLSISDRYYLRPGSPAENAGDNNPPGGLGTTDRDGRPRIIDGTVDIGMYEGIIVVFVDGFETGDTTSWTSATP
ncbi:MAG: right-handed parallel beta-helix repeat-containing protein [Thermoanaerobaculia bacterium]